MGNGSERKLGFDQAKLARITGAMQGFIDRGETAGMNLLIARHGVTVYEECLGLADIEAGKPMAASTIFRIYSMSKPITMVAALFLHERGCFDLDDPISKYIPAFKGQSVLQSISGDHLVTAPVKWEVSIRHLLTMTSGIPYPGANTDIERVYQKAADAAAPAGEDLSTQEAVGLIASLPLAFEPGTQWLYGYSHDVIGRLVEVLSGKPYDRFLQDEIFAPLGMVDTGFTVPREKADRFAAAYGPGEQGRLALVDAPGGSRYLQPQAFLSGGGGLVSTVGDYALFAQMLLHGGEWNGARILGRKTIQLMAANHLAADLPGWDTAGGFSYGLGVRVMLDPAKAGYGGSAGLFGWEGYASTWFCVDPAEDLIGILMTQFIPHGTHPFDLRFKTMLYAALV